MFDYDRSNFIAYLKDFPKQISKSQEIMKNFLFKVDNSTIRNIVLTGMGGSAISGDLFLICSWHISTMN
jgi:glucose-6-phosphate isomerase